MPLNYLPKKNHVQEELYRKISHFLNLGIEVTIMSLFKKKNKKQIFISLIVQNKRTEQAMTNTIVLHARLAF